MTDEVKSIIGRLRDYIRRYADPTSFANPIKGTAEILREAADLIEKLSSEPDCVKAELALETAEKASDRDKLLNLLAAYFNIGDSYEYSLTRIKEAFELGTMTFEDFSEFDDAKVAEIADYLIDHGVVVARHGQRKEYEGADERGQEYFVKRQAATRQHDMISCQTCRLYGKCGKEQTDGLECCKDWENGGAK